MKRYGGYIKFMALLFLICLLLSSCKVKIRFRYPTITYGEFPFRIEYKLEGNDEIFVIEDTLVCEFDGHELLPLPAWFDMGTGKSLYKESLMSGQEELSFTLISNETFTIKYEIGSGGYYLDDLAAYDSSYNRFVVYEKQSSIEIYHNLQEELEKYGVYLIDYTCAESIDNSFEYHYSNKYGEKHRRTLYVLTKTK